MNNDKIDKIIEEINSAPAHNELNKRIAVALCEEDGIDPYKEVYAPGGGMIPAWEYVISEADLIRRTAIRLGWIAGEDTIKNYGGTD